VERRRTTRHARFGFVGREHELALLTDRLHTAAGGEGQVVLVTGEPGIGKSRLAEEIAARADALGMRCCRGRATDAEGSPPYWPFRQILRALHDRDTDDLVPVLGGSVEPVTEQRFRLFEAVTEALVVAAEPSGLLLVLDDLHWADPASLQLLLHLTRRAAGARLAVVATYRDAEANGHDPMRAVLGELAREPSVTRLRLTGLSEPEVGALVAGVTGWQLPASATAALVRRTQGNAFFVGELARLLAGDAAAGGNLPDGVRDAVRVRLDRLSPRCRQVVSSAAVLGSTVVPSALAAAMGRDVEDVLAVLDEAASAGIVVDLRFGLDLIPEGYTRSLPAGEAVSGAHGRGEDHGHPIVEITGRRWRRIGRCEPGSTTAPDRPVGRTAENLEAGHRPRPRHLTLTQAATF
jgi:predicted ATPase